MNNELQDLYEELLVNDARVIKCERYLSNGVKIEIEGTPMPGGICEGNIIILGPKNIEHDLMVLYRHVLLHNELIVECIKKTDGYEIVLSRMWMGRGKRTIPFEKTIELKER